MNAQCATLEQRLLEYIFGKIRKARAIAIQEFIVNEAHIGKRNLSDIVTDLILSEYNRRIAS